MPKLIYLASPYTVGNAGPDLREKRFFAACEATAKLMSEGHVVFSPIVHSHPLSNICQLPKTWEFWEKQDREFISRCDEVHVLMLPGWDKSVGITAECRIAAELNKPVFFLSP